MAEPSHRGKENSTNAVATNVATWGEEVKPPMYAQ